MNLFSRNKESSDPGIIIDNYIPENIAIKYEQSGAGALSILTEQYFFKGSSEVSICIFL